MKKLIFALCLLALPFARSHAQLDVSGVAGDNGYSVLRASFTTPFVLLPGMSLQAKYALFQLDGQSDMSRYALGLNYKLPFIDIVSAGAEFGFQPKANAYSNHYYDIHGALELNELLFRMLPADELRLSAGYRRIYHSFYEDSFFPKEHLSENDIYANIFQRTGGFDTSVYATKVMSYSGELNRTLPWLDVPYFISAYQGFMDYSIGASAGYTFSFIRPFAAYNILKFKNDEATDNMRVGVTAKILSVSVNAAVEWLNFTRNSENRERFYSLSAGVSLF